jgi:excisionase family DNA binding protein
MPDTNTVTPERKRRNRRPAPIAAPKLAFSILEACAALGISRPTYYELVKRGDLRPVKVNGRVLIPATELERLLSGDSSE